MKPFATTDLLEKHLYNSAPHVSEIRCLECSHTFPTVASLERHGNSCKPRSVTIQKNENEHYCSPCEKTFYNADALEKHRNSLIHKPLSTNLTCLGGCGKSFSAPSSMVMHLESGACTGDVGSKVDKKVLDKSVFETDVDGVICHGTVPAAIAETPNSEMSMADSGFSTPGGVPVILTPSSSTMVGTSSGMFTPLSPGATDGSMQWILPMNPLCCPLCPSSRPPFINERALEQHLASPTHAPKIYHCPETLFTEASKGPRMEFVSLSGLMQHLEAGACAGGGKKGRSIFTKAVRFVEDKLREMGILGDMKLIG
jgi:hypothetical protein